MVGITIHVDDAHKPFGLYQSQIYGDRVDLSYTAAKRQLRISIATVTRLSSCSSSYMPMI